MLSQKKRFEVLKRDNFRCQYCGKTGKDVTLEVDHIKPRSKWWTDNMENLITCCRECNMGKWNIGIDEISTSKIKETDLGDRIIKEFYEERNKLKLGTIDQRTSKLLVISIRDDIQDLKEDAIYISCEKKEIEKNNNFHETDDIRKQRLEEYEKWGEIMDSALALAYDRISETAKWYIDDVIGDGWTWGTNTEKLNYMISYYNCDSDRTKRAVKRYTLFPNKVKEWQNK